MWIDQSNKITQDDIVSPLNHDVSGAFSRSGIKSNKKQQYLKWFDTWLIILYIGFIYCIDLLLFAGSGNLQVFNNSFFPVAEVSVIMAAIFLVATVLILPFHRKDVIKYSIAAFATGGVVYILFRQFFQYHQHLYVGVHTVPISVVAALIMAFIAFAIFKSRHFIYRMLFVVAIGVLFFNIYTHYYTDMANHEFEETYNHSVNSVANEQRIIYLMLPNLTSYAYLSTLSIPEAATTRDIMQGFLQKNNFKIFTRAYTPDKSYLNNMIFSLNPTSDKSAQAHTLASYLLDRYWRFYNLRKEYIHLQNNELYDYLNNNDFQISAYKSRDFDMCRKNHKFNVNRCIEKINKPVSLYNTNLPLSTKAGVLTIEWLSSMHIFGEIPAIFNFLNKYINLEKLPMVGIDFNNLYVINSIKTFDVLLKDIEQDKGKQAYIVFMDLPSNMYVYDEFCRIKEQQQWQNMTDVPWIKHNYEKDREEAYLQQMRCLFGKLEQFMENLKNNNLSGNTTIILQSVSGVSDFKRNNAEDDAVMRFLGNRSVTMAIYNNEQKYDTDNRMCKTNELLAEYLYQNEHCNEYLDGYHENVAQTIKQKIRDLTANINKNSVDVFETWYKKWLINNSTDTTSDTNLIIQIKQEDDLGIDDLYSASDKRSATSTEEK